MNETPCPTAPKVSVAAGTGNSPAGAELGRLAIQCDEILLGERSGQIEISQCLDRQCDLAVIDNGRQVPADELLPMSPFRSQSSGSSLRSCSKRRPSLRR